MRTGFAGKSKGNPGGVPTLERSLNRHGGPVTAKLTQTADELASRGLSNQSRLEAFLALQEKQHEAHRREGEEIKIVSSRFPFTAPLERFDDFLNQSAQAEIA